MRYTTIFFDLDDTLWDTTANSRESLEEVYRLFSFDNYYSRFEDFYAIYYPYNIGLWDMYERHEITKSELMGDRFYTPFKHIEGLTKEKSDKINLEFMMRTSSKSGTIDGAKEILKLLKPHYKICVLSNGFNEVQFKKIRSAGLDDFFDSIVLSDDIGINKPDKKLFAYALDKMSTTPDRSIMIGDNWKSDILGAFNSGIDQVWYNPDNKHPDVFNPTYTIRKLNELKDILLSDK